MEKWKINTLIEKYLDSKSTDNDIEVDPGEVQFEIFNQSTNPLRKIIFTVNPNDGNPLITIHTGSRCAAENNEYKYPEIATYIRESGTWESVTDSTDLSLTEDITIPLPLDIEDSSYSLKKIGASLFTLIAYQPGSVPHRLRKCGAEPPAQRQRIDDFAFWNP